MPRNCFWAVDMVVRPGRRTIPNSSLERGVAHGDEWRHGRRLLGGNFLSCTVVVRNRIAATAHTRAQRARGREPLSVLHPTVNLKIGPQRLRSGPRPELGTISIPTSGRSSRHLDKPVEA